MGGVLPNGGEFLQEIGREKLRKKIRHGQSDFLMAAGSKLVKLVQSESELRDPVPSRDPEALLTLDEVAELLRVPASWVYGRTRRRNSDRIPGFRLGKYWRFRLTDVLAWLEKQRAGTRANA
jgi:excisionase family DNA binding protein